MCEVCFWKPRAIRLSPVLMNTAAMILVGGLSIPLLFSGGSSAQSHHQIGIVIIVAFFFSSEELLKSHFLLIFKKKTLEIVLSQRHRSFGFFSCYSDRFHQNHPLLSDRNHFKKTLSPQLYLD